MNFIKFCRTILFADDVLYNERLKEILFTIANKELNFNVLIALAKTLKKVILKENSVCGKETSIHYLCKKIDLKESVSINNIFKNVKLMKNEKLEIVGNIPEGEIFILDNEFLKEEFGVEINKKINSNENIIKINNENDDNKYIN